jgi:mannose-6-phosphate isomerase-like protein (cupin superfamily)
LGTTVKKYSFLGSNEILEPLNNLVLRQIISNEDHDGAISLTWVSIDGEHKTLCTHSKLRVYFVISGELEFEIDGTHSLLLKKHDALTLESGSTYSLTGTAEYLVLNSPAFVDGDDEYL